MSYNLTTMQSIYHGQDEIVEISYNGSLVYQKSSGPDYTEPFYVENISNDVETLSIARSSSSAPILTIEYSTDKTTWQTLGTTSITALTYTLQPDDKVYLRCNTDEGWGATGTDGSSNRISGCSKVGGNIMSLIYGSNFTGSETTFKNNTYQTFRSLFDSDTVLEDAQYLLLPAPALVPSCYRAMFGGCTNLMTAPELPATNLAEYCYRYMFTGTKITVAPALPATTLATGCYYQMFHRTGIIVAPVLPATTLADECYYFMFKECTSLTTAPELPATTLASYCYVSMFLGCTSLTTAPTLPATTLVGYCYQSMFYGCTSLTAAPALLATTLTSGCYRQMFLGCTSLNYIKAMFTTTPSDSYTLNWVSGVASSGTFVKNSAATWNITGDNGIPTGWTVETADVAN